MTFAVLHPTLVSFVNKFITNHIVLLVAQCGEHPGMRFQNQVCAGKIALDERTNLIQPSAKSIIYGLVDRGSICCSL